MRIGIDVDGVLSNTLVAIHALFPVWDTTKGWYGGNTQEAFDEGWANAKSINNFWLGIPVLDTASPRLMIELNEAHDLYFITDRFDTVGGSAVHQTMNWLLFQLLAGSVPAGVIVTKNKGPVAAMLGLDYFIDDKPQNCENVMKIVPNCKTYLCTCPHNQSWEGDVPRVANFNEFARMILAKT